MQSQQVPELQKFQKILPGRRVWTCVYHAISMKVVHGEAVRDVITQEPKQNLAQIYGQMQMQHEEPIRDRSEPKIVRICDSMQVVRGAAMDKREEAFMQDRTNKPKQNIVQIYGAHLSSSILALSCDLKNFCRRFLDDTSCLQVFGKIEFSTAKCYPKTRQGIEQFPAHEN